MNHCVFVAATRNFLRSVYGISRLLAALCSLTCSLLIRLCPFAVASRLIDRDLCPTIKSKKNDIINFDNDVRFGVGIESFSRIRLDRFSVFTRRIPNERRTRGSFGDAFIYHIFQTLAVFAHTRIFRLSAHCLHRSSRSAGATTGRELGTQSIFHKQKCEKRMAKWGNENQSMLGTQGSRRWCA